MNSKEIIDAFTYVANEKGIDKKKLTAKGYGSTAPIDSNETLEGRQNNRRTEFEIIGN